MNNKAKLFGGLLATAVIATLGITTVEAREPHHKHHHKPAIRWERVVLDLLTPGCFRYEVVRPAPPPPPPRGHFRPAPPQKHVRPAPPPPPQGHRR